ncbi:hypothetical protein IFM89_015375, partial [Coptis chinensis]
IIIFLSLGFATSKYKYNKFISSGNEALEDFKTLVTVDYDRRVIISCCRSSLAFLGETLLLGFVIVIVFRALVKLGYWVFGLGGVVMEVGFLFRGGMGVLLEEKWWLRKRGEKLPKWWPDVVQASSVVSGNDNQELQKEANRVIRDIGSFYRSSVDFVLNSAASSASSSTFAQIDGEDARQFVAGLADCIGLQNVHNGCSTDTFMFSAGLGKRTEAQMELLKICIILQIFPPQESSPEMEMVVRGLKTHLRVEQRELLLNLLTGICGPASKSGAEALGLINRPSVEDDMWHLTS